MADHQDYDLPYGNFGLANYDPEQQTWIFERSEGTSDRFHILGPPKSVAGPAVQVPRSDSSRSTQPSLRHPSEIQALVKRLPELQPASSLLPAHLRLSEAVEAAVDRHDARKGNLLDLGTIVSEASGHAITIAAFPCGTTGTDLRLVHVQAQKRGWDDSKSAWLNVPTIHGEEAIWCGPGAAIQQVCFAKAIDRTDAFLAVRMLTKTLLFRPILRKTPKSSSGASRLDTNLCVKLQLSEKTGFPHADVSFNPWYTRQCAVVDQAGGWEVWELQDRNTLTVKRFCWYHPFTPDGSEGSRVPFDGWACITWVANLFTIAVATRKVVRMHNITSGGEVTNAVCLLDLHGSDNWILDMATLPSRPSHMCLLTSTHIMLYYIDESSPGSFRFWSLGRVKHFRNPNDITMRFSAFVLGSQVAILLRSDVDSIVAVYFVTFDNQDGVHITIPSDLNVTSANTPRRYLHSVAGWHLAEVGFGTHPRVKSDSVALPLRDSGVTFAALTILDTMLYISPLNCAPRIPVLAWESRPGVTTRRLRKEAFIVDDDDEGPIEPGDETQRTVSAFAARRMRANTARAGKAWTLPLSGVAEALQTPASSELDTVVDILELTEARLSAKQDDDILPWRILTDIASTELAVSDMDEAQSRVEALLSLPAKTLHVPPEDATEASTAVQVAVSDITSGRTGSISDVRAAIVRDWIAPLAPDVTGRVRLAKEQLARRMAAEVALAARVLRTPLSTLDSRSGAQPTQESFDIPVRAGPSIDAVPQSSQVASQPSVLPTPSPSATPSLMTASSHPSSFAALEISRLSKYTTISGPPTSSLPRSLNNVLSHWKIGADLADYDWRSTTKRLAQHEDEQNDEQMTEKERLRVQRRAERHIKRQRREAAASQAQQFASSQAPEIFSASQPQQVQRKVESQPTGAAASSQSVGFGRMPASQVVPGRFGGRPPKKKRKQGF
ncbi:hypothetical protein LTS14_002243 [Recurvomyces mirabilis]|uniref:uncharacterized protein n=1 Tax=Recurvomyces mirabilis TaxID=574656 RepID=UPI002DDE993C|nr:hypothetical protein LTS14_002243 [Recurvomyces mirabilis]